MTTTIRASGHPEPGEVYWVDLDPVLGSEQAGRPPVIVLSDDSLHQFSSRILICPITSNPQPWPTKVEIPAGCVVRGSGASLRSPLWWAGFVLTAAAIFLQRMASQQGGTP